MKKIDFNNLKEITYQKMYAFHISTPVPLEEIDNNYFWVYWRPYGIFYVDGAYHQAAMALFYALHSGYDNTIDFQKKEDKTTSEMADAFLELEGTAFFSSVGKYIPKAGHKGNLNRKELNIFGEVDYILDD
jgi:hypothetical protein